MSSACVGGERSDLIHHQFDLGGQSFTIELPSEFQRDPNVAVVQFSRPEYRNVRSLRFTTSLPILSESVHQTTLSQGGKLNYDIVTHGGGSGGNEAELVGHLELGQSSIGVTATDQDEFSPNPEWCIEFLHTLKMITF